MKKPKALNRRRREYEGVSTELRRYSRIEVDEMLREALSWNYPLVKKYANSNTIPILQRIVASILKRGADEGCQFCLGFVLDRLMGKAKMQSPIFDVASGQLIEQPEKTEEEKEKAIIYEVVMSDAGKFKYPRPRLISAGS